MAKTNIEELEIGQLLSMRLLIEKKKKNTTLPVYLNRNFTSPFQSKREKGKKKIHDKKMREEKGKQKEETRAQ